ncbi:lytic transglycosylase domain-containing protein [Actinomadura sp. SCN-SB]|uniref:aggregation-promoting factor C-terminal-like domain-containing protein n=1 Tax=Actinomadura sp. SCN-SB TaxID=3373092 RepID=UPI0037515FBF
MPQSHGTRRRHAAPQQKRGGRRRARQGGGPPAAGSAAPAREAYDPYQDPYGLDRPDEPSLREELRSRPPRRKRPSGPGKARRMLTSNVTITAVAIGAVLAAVVMVDFDRLSGEQSRPSGAAVGNLTANDMLAMMSSSDIDAVSADVIAAAKKRAYEKHQAELKALREKAKRDAAARARLRAQQERERLAKSNPSAQQNKAYGKKMNELKGWGRCWSSLETLWDHESGWNERAENPSSGAYGIPQSLPGSKMASAGADWRTSSPTQIAWGLGYIKARYKNPCGAWAFWQSHHWY